MITNNKGVLISPINTSTHKLAYIRSNIEISNKNRNLRITSNNVTTYFELENHREKIKMKQRVKSIPENFRPYEYCLKSSYLNISSNSHSIEFSQTRDINLEEWFNSQIDIENISNFVNLLEAR